uniref:Cytochrome c biogenesis protein CcsA n=1 Tax=Bulboplastis apyrenoidosa TaxID=1070855 RepID=A0A1Y9TM51_9RHOD|nr:cytochrome c biogenesis protein [Bulboplastis apyrenoidosa]ARO90716.1 cytochrome c biogenesis protein [Bulboplastis apyrenoidosa]
MLTWIKIENICINTTFLISIISTLIYWIYLVFPQKNSISKIGYGLVCLSCFFLTIGLSLRWIINHYFPLSNLYESLLFLSWAFMSIQIVLEYKLKNIFVGAVSTSVTMFTLGYSSLFLPIEMQKAEPLVPALKSNWLMMHVSVMILSYATLMIGCLLSIMFLIISSKKMVSLNMNNSSKVQKMSSSNINLLDNLDNMSYRIISLGFPLLTLGIIAGAIWANEAWGSYWSWDPKETWALITWLIFAIYLHTRINQSWQGKKPAIIATLGFIIIWVCYLGVNFIGKGLHSYGWIS